MRYPNRLVVPALLVVLVTGHSLTTAQEMDNDAPPDTPLPEETRLLISDVREAVAPFRDLDVAMDEGYGSFQDCFKDETIGGMGQHYVSGELAGDDVADPLQPEALVYEPQEDGSLILVALEYLIFADQWDPNNEGREAPTLFGQDFHLETTIPDTPPVWALHLWLFSHNPEGLFADYNPIIFCPEPALMSKTVR